MKTNKIQNAIFQKKNLILFVVAFILILIGSTNLVSRPALSFLNKIIEEMFVSLGLALELKSIALSVENSKIPVVGGFALELVEILNKVIDYLTFSNIVITSQKLFVKLGQSLFFKLLPVVFLLGIYWEKYRLLFVKILMVALMINPGIALYVNGIQYVSTVMKISMASPLKKHLEKTELKFDEKKKRNEEKQIERKKKQLKKALHKGHKEINLFEKTEDFIFDKTQDVGNVVQKDVSEAYILLKEGKKEMLDLVINMISNVIFLFVILPLVYFYMMKIVLRKTFDFQA